MTRDETKKLLKVIVSMYPNWKPNDMTETIDAWHWALEEYPYHAIQIAYKMYLKTDKSGFAPSVNQLITNLTKPAESEALTEQEAWTLVKKALKNGNYGYEEEYAKLPPLVQKVVGGSSMIRQWAAMDSEEVNTVVASNFQRSYKVIAKREIEDLAISKEKTMLTELTKNLANRIDANRSTALITENTNGTEKE